MLHYYQGRSTSNIWERRLKHQQFSQWVSSLARRDERSCFSPPADSPVTGLRRRGATVSRAARPVMWMRWQESRQVPSEPPGAGQQWFIVWTSRLAQCVLDCCGTVLPSQGTSVWSWCKFSLYTTVRPSVTHLFLLCVSLSTSSYVLFLSLGVWPTLSSPLPLFIHFQKDCDLADTDWRGDGNCWDPHVPSPGWHLFFSNEKLAKNFFFISSVFCFFHSVFFRFLSLSSVFHQGIIYSCLFWCSPAAQVWESAL